MILSLLQVVTPKQLWNNTEDRPTSKETTHWCVDFLKLREHLCIVSLEGTKLDPFECKSEGRKNET